MTSSSTVILSLADSMIVLRNVFLDLKDSHISCIENTQGQKNNIESISSLITCQFLSDQKTPLSDCNISAVRRFLRLSSQALFSWGRSSFLKLSYHKQKYSCINKSTTKWQRSVTTIVWIDSRVNSPRTVYSESLVNTLCGLRRFLPLPPFPRPLTHFCVLKNLSSHSVPPRTPPHPTPPVHKSLSSIHRPLKHTCRITTCRITTFLFQLLQTHTQFQLLN